MCVCVCECVTDDQARCQIASQKRSQTWTTEVNECFLFFCRVTWSCEAPVVLQVQTDATKSSARLLWAAAVEKLQVSDLQIFFSHKLIKSWVVRGSDPLTSTRFYTQWRRGYFGLLLQYVSHFIHTFSFLRDSDSSAVSCKEVSVEAADAAALPPKFSLCFNSCSSCKNNFSCIFQVAHWISHYNVEFEHWITPHLKSPQHETTCIWPGKPKAQISVKLFYIFYLELICMSGRKQNCEHHQIHSNLN